VGLTREEAYLRVAAVVVLLALGALVAGNVVESRVNPEPTRFERTVRCLEREKGFPIYDPSVDSAAFRAGVDAVSTTIEGNSVTIAVVGSESAAAELEQRVRRNVGAARVERREDVVYEWAAAPSPTQKQGAYDCEYLPED
jgi:hypothetical protein